MTAIEEPLNLTPHEVVIGAGAGRAVLPASGQVARLLSTPQVPLATVHVGALHVDAYSPPSFTEVVGLETLAPTSGRPIVVSAMVAEYMVSTKHPYRGAILAPDTGPASVLRDTEGRIVGVGRLILYR